MYYTSSGAYRKTKVFLDYANVVLTIGIAFLFVLLLVFGNMREIFFTAIFFTGMVINGLGAVKKVLDKQKVVAIIRGIVAVGLGVLGVMCLMTVI